jgi:tRNA (mo5U34)-methyltransferase
VIVSEISRQAAIFRDEIMRLKLTLNNSDFWYRYSTLSNFEHLENLFGGDSDLLSKITADGPILDIGGADGDLAFFLNTLGVSVSALEHAPTNHNGLEGMKLLNNHFGSPLDIKEADLDAGGTIEGKYSLVYFLGVLYHLKNPYLVLENLAKCSKYVLLSTKIFKYIPGVESPLGENSLAYLLDPTECNGDNTNYWIFSETGLRRLVERCGFEVVLFDVYGAKETAEPASMEHDGRAFCLLRSNQI